MASMIWTGALGGGILLASAWGITSVADDSRSLALDEIASESPVPGPQHINQPTPPPLGTPAGTQCAQTLPSGCRTGDQGRLARFRQRCQAKYWGYPEYFCEPPLGATLVGFQLTQIIHGQAARMAFYQYDFLPDSEELNTRGKSQLTQISIWASSNRFPVFVEPTAANPALDELRRQVVWTGLAGIQFSIPSERVVIGRPNVRGLDATDAMSIDRNRLELTASRGSAGGGQSSTSTSGPTESSGTTDTGN